MSATRTAESTVTRVNLGPLTTTFSPPRGCDSLHFIDDGLVMLDAYSDYYCPDDWKRTRFSICTTGSCSGNIMAQSSFVSLIESCYPSGLAPYWNAMADQENNGATFQPGIFSPGLICPSGYSPDCTIVRNKGTTNPAAANSAAVADNAISGLLDDGETAIGCCPFNCTCDSYDAHMCTSRPISGGAITVTDSAVCSTVIKPYLTTATALTAWAARVLLIQSNTPTNRPSTPSYTSSPNSNNLSYGIAIIVTPSLVGGGAIVIAIVCFACCIGKSRRRKLKPQVRARDGNSDILGKVEVQGSSGIAISRPNGTALENSPVDGTARYEMAAGIELSARG